MTVDREMRRDELEGLYQEPYFTGGEYADYLKDKPVHLKTLAGHLRLLERYVKPPGRVLEIGSAYGFFLELLRGGYPDCLGIDVSRAAVAHARACGLNARVAAVEELDEEADYDAVCMWDTVEHLPDPESAVAKACALLKPQGYLFLTTGDFGAWLPWIQGFRWRQIHPPTHLFYFTRKSLRCLVERSGFTVVRFGTVTVYRRFGSSLETMTRLGKTPLVPRLAGIAVRCFPKTLLERGFPLNLGDTLYLVARKEQAGQKGDTTS